MEEAWKAAEELNFALNLTDHDIKIPRKGLIVFESHLKVYDPFLTATAEPIASRIGSGEQIVLLTRQLKEEGSYAGATIKQDQGRTDKSHRRREPQSL